MCLRKHGRLRLSGGQRRRRWALSGKRFASRFKRSVRTYTVAVHCANPARTSCFLDQVQSVITRFPQHPPRQHSGGGASAAEMCCWCHRRCAALPAARHDDLKGDPQRPFGFHLHLDLRLAPRSWSRHDAFACTPPSSPAAAAVIFK